MASRDSATADFTTASSTAIDTILAEEANRIGSDIHKRVNHTSPWIDLVKKSSFPDGMGYKLTTLVYDRALPTTDDDGDVLGANWDDVGLVAAANEFGSSMLDQPIADAADQVQGANGPGGTNLGTSGDRRGYVNFSKVIKQYNIKRSVLESPRINVDDLRYAAHRQEQLRAVMDSLAEATRWTWETRYRDEFDRLSDNTVACRTSGTYFSTGNEGDLLRDQDGVSGNTAVGTVDDASAGVSDDTASGVTGDISNAVLDKVYNQLVRKGAGRNAYGRENGRPVFALVCSSEASYGLMTESTAFRDDIRYNNARVSELIAPLGVEKSFRGFYHLIDDLTPRYAVALGSGQSAGNTLDVVYPYKVTNGIVTDNADYDNAPFEAAFVIHPEVFESQIPQPFSGAGGVTFDPVSYQGDFKWKNILSEAANPDGTIGFFRGVLASASKPIKTDFGYTIIFKRNTTAAGV
jgi:hypothetical protein